MKITKFVTSESIIEDIDISECRNVWLDTNLTKELSRKLNNDRRLEKLYLTVRTAIDKTLQIYSPTVRTIICVTYPESGLEEFDFKGCESLQICEIGQQTKISDLEGLRNLSELKCLSFGRYTYSYIAENACSFDEIEDTRLSTEHNLPNATCFNTFISDLSALENMKSLQILDISALNCVSSESLFKLVKSLPNLKAIKGFEINSAIMYSDELVNYCNENGIKHPFTQRSKDIKTEIKRIVSEIITPEMSDKEKVKAITRFVINHMEYNTEAYDTAITGQTIDEDTYKKIWQEKLYYSLFDGVGVCDGYEALTHALLQEAKVNSYREEGRMHTWELVEIDGEYYQLDTTKLDHYLEKKHLDIKRVGIGDPYYLIQDGDEYYQKEYVRPNDSEVKKSIFRRILEATGILHPYPISTYTSLNDVLTINYQKSVLTEEDLHNAGHMIYVESGKQEKTNEEECRFGR